METRNIWNGKGLLTQPKGQEAWIRRRSACDKFWRSTRLDAYFYPCLFSFVKAEMRRSSWFKSCLSEALPSWKNRKKLEYHKLKNLFWSLIYHEFFWNGKNRKFASRKAIKIFITAYSNNFFSPRKCTRVTGMIAANFEACWSTQMLNPSAFSRHVSWRAAL